MRWIRLGHRSDNGSRIRNAKCRRRKIITNSCECIRENLPWLDKNTECFFVVFMSILKNMTQCSIKMENSFANMKKATIVNNKFR